MPKKVTRINQSAFNRYVFFHNKFLFLIAKYLTNFIEFKRVYIFNILTRYFYVGNFCFSYYGVKLFYPNFKDPTFRYCNGGAYGDKYSNFLKTLSERYYFIDVGANIGIYSLISSQNNNCKKVIAFEPNPKVFKLLKKNFINIKNFELFNLAISNKNGKASFFLDPKSSGSSKISKQNTNLSVQTVNNKFLKKKLQSSFKYNIKIDVEGHELIVLNELLSSLSIKQINSIYIEVKNKETIIKYYKKRLKNFKLVYFKAGKKRADCLFIKNKKNKLLKKFSNPRVNKKT